MQRPRGTRLRPKSASPRQKLSTPWQKEAQLANDLDDDIRAAITSMQGWLALLEGNASACVAADQHSFDLWKGRHGDEHPSTAWGYVLLGGAKAQGSDLAAALADLHKGLAILDQTVGQQDARDLKAEIAYAQLIERTGARTEAARGKNRRRARATGPAPP